MGRIQIKAEVSSYAVGEGGDFKEEMSIFKRGDIIGVEGKPCRTKNGELSVLAEKIRLLSPAIRLFPSPQNPLEDIDARFRNRSVDLIANPEKREILRTRSKILREIRNFLDDEGYLEAETPILDIRYGGAAAAPFKTYHNDFDIPMYLRIAPELFLNRLTIGGFDKVYEIGKQFRNESVDKTHNPEFTSLEVYTAYADYKDCMALTSKLLRWVIKSLYDEEMKVPYVMKGRPILLDFKTKFNRYEYFDCVQSALGKILPEPLDVEADTQ